MLHQVTAGDAIVTFYYDIFKLVITNLFYHLYFVCFSCDVSKLNFSKLVFINLIVFIPDFYIFIYLYF